MFPNIKSPLLGFDNSKNTTFLIYRLHLLFDLLGGNCFAICDYWKYVDSFL